MFKSENVDIGGGQHIRYYRAGEGSRRKLLFLHGSGPGVTALSNWRGAITRLSDEFDCIAPDVLGFGDSFHPPEPLEAEEILELRIESLVNFVRALNLGSVDLIGNSMGGRLSIELLLRYPSEFPRATLMGTGGVAIKIPTTLSNVRGFYDEPTKERLTEIFKNFLFDPSVLGDLAKLAEERFSIATREEVRRSHLSTFNNGPAALDLQRVGTITAPVSLIHGREDRVIPYEASLTLLGVLPRAEAHIIGECGHWLQLEKTAEFDALVRAFHGN